MSNKNSELKMNLSNLFYETKIRTAADLVEGRRTPKLWWYWTQVVCGAIFGAIILYVFLLFAAIW